MIVSAAPSTSFRDIIDYNGIGNESWIIIKAIGESNKHYNIPYYRVHDNIDFKFYELLSSWEADTSYISSISEMSIHPDYQRIIGMGAQVLPLIFSELKKRPVHFFWALKAITGEDPVPPEFRGDIEKMRTSWMEWGKENGYL